MKNSAEKHGFWELGDELWRVYQCHNHQQVVRGVHLDQDRSEISFSASLKKMNRIVCRATQPTAASERQYILNQVFGIHSNPEKR